MPTLKKIVVQDYRNIVLQELSFSPNINCISGNNGSGKTNLLDAIYYLSMTKSAASTSDRFNFRHGTSAFTIAGTYLFENGAESRISIQVAGEGQKKVKKDDKFYPKVSEHVGVLPVVMVSPSDVSMVSESGEERRRFVNAMLSQMDKEYLSALQQYNRLLLQRNKLLKGPSPDGMLLDTIDAMMSSVAEPVKARRKALVEELSPIVSDYYSRLSGGGESVAIEYRPDIEGASLEDVFRERRQRDLAAGFTTSGIQRDDFLFTMDGFPIRKCGSQGQQKSFLVSLKFAQYECMKKSCGIAPVLLLDDLFDKLDTRRVANLLKMVAGEEFGQIFITDSNKTRISGIVDSITEDRSYYDTVSGVFTRMED